MSTKFYPFSDLSETLVEHSALSVVDGRPWDMHRPLEGDCELQLKSFHDLDPFHVNKAFWRSCSFLLGYACESVFGENVPIKLHSFPPPNGMYQFYGCTITQRCKKIGNFKKQARRCLSKLVGDKSMWWRNLPVLIGIGLT